MKSALSLAALTTLAAAYNHGFPNDSSFHAHCHLSATLANTSCADAKAKADELIKTNVDTDSEYKGQMSIHDEGDDWIYSKRLTYNKKYTDDQLFEFVADGSGCTINARSQSESLSYLDNGVNYCNMWNVLSRIPGFSTCTSSSCHNDVSDPKTTCARY